MVKKNEGKGERWCKRIMYKKTTHRAILPSISSVESPNICQRYRRAEKTRRYRRDGKGRESSAEDYREKRTTDPVFVPLPPPFGSFDERNPQFRSPRPYGPRIFPSRASPCFDRIAAADSWPFRYKHVPPVADALNRTSSGRSGSRPRPSPHAVCNRESCTCLRHGA